MGIFDNNMTTENKSKDIADSLVNITKNTFDKIKISRLGFFKFLLLIFNFFIAKIIKFPIPGYGMTI